MYQTTTGNDLVGIGAEALTRNTTGSNNVAIGKEALSRNTTASDNTAVGYNASFTNTTGTYNTALGKDSLLSNTTASSNTAVGFWSCRSNTTGVGNVAMGSTALNANTTGNENTAIGGGQYGTSPAALNDNTTGSENTAIGARAGNNNTTGSNNVFVGYNAAAASATDGDQIVIGTNISSIGGNYFTFGNDSIGRVYNQFSSNASWTRTSDVRLKKDIQDNTDLGLDFVNDLRTVTYKWKAPSEQPTNFLSYDADVTEPVYTNKMYGFIAQEVKAVLDDHSVTDFNGWTQTEGNGDVQGISYEMFVMPLIKAMQELSAKNDALEARIATLEG
jgi:hypothetical protein